MATMTEPGAAAQVRAFNGDPHPGNYLFQRGGRVTFLDFGLVRRFSPGELQPLMRMARTICVEHDPETFRASLEHAGFLRPGAISEEIWPFVHGPAATPTAEAAWQARHQAATA
jgi:hypothetical protein